MLKNFKDKVIKLKILKDKFKKEKQHILSGDIVQVGQ